MLEISQEGPRTAPRAVEAVAGTVRLASAGPEAQMLPEPRVQSDMAAAAAEVVAAAAVMAAAATEVEEAVVTTEIINHISSKKLNPPIFRGIFVFQRLAVFLINRLVQIKKNLMHEFAGCLFLNILKSANFHGVKPIPR